MSQVFTIAVREFRAMVGTKAFIASLVIFPILMLGGLAIMPLIQNVGGPENRRIVVHDASESNRWVTALKQSAQIRNDAIRQRIDSGGDSTEKEKFSGIEFFEIESQDESMDDARRLELSRSIRDGDLHAFAEIPADLNADIPVRFVSSNAIVDGAKRWVESTLRDVVRRERLTAAGIDADAVDAADAAITIESLMPYDLDDDGELTTESSERSMASMFLPFGVMMLMFMVIFMAAQPMLESGMEEKQYRIAELLLGSVSPTKLMTGKLLGNVAGSFVVFAFYAVGGLIVARYNDWSLQLDAASMPWLVVFQILGVLFFSSIFLTIGASVSELKEAQSLLMPVWLVLLLPMMIWFNAVQSPNGPVATALSFFPPSAPLMMSLRMAGAQTVPAWQPPVAAIVLVIATGIVLKIAAKIYRVSLLKSDSAGSFAALWKRLRSA